MLAGMLSLEIVKDLETNEIHISEDDGSDDAEDEIVIDEE